MAVEHGDDCEYLGGVVVLCRCPTSLPKSRLELARDLLCGMDERHQDRLSSGNVGEWQTELNEVRRILHYILNDPAAP